MSPEHIKIAVEAVLIACGQEDREYSVEVKEHPHWKEAKIAYINEVVRGHGEGQYGKDDEDKYDTYTIAITDSVIATPDHFELSRVVDKVLKAIEEIEQTEIIYT